MTHDLRLHECGNLNALVVRQKPALENASQATMEHPQNAGRGRSRRPSSALAVDRDSEDRRVSDDRVRVNEDRVHVRARQELSSDEIQKLVEQEAERVARELAEEPSSSLLALSDARREMDDMAIKAQVPVREAHLCDTAVFLLS